MAFVTTAFGVVPILIAIGVIELDAGSVHAPMWVLAMCGGVFILAGIMVLLGQNSRASYFLAALLCLCFAAIGGWVAPAAAAENFGGIPFVPSKTNFSIGRIAFGLGALLCLACSYLTLMKALRDQ
ncbi:MAG: hypothetical protein R2832_14985 [Rhodothermales bacterium]